MSDYWFNEAEINDLLRVEGPLGSFFLRKDQKKENLIFLATGTGIATIKAILEDLDSNPQMCLYKNIYLYWGGRHKIDLYWRPTFNNLTINFNPIISRKDTEWDGKVGYVQDNLLNDKINLENSVIYSCGSDVMIESAKEKLLTNGLPKESYYYDAFVSSS